MEPYEEKIKNLNLRKPFMKLWSIFSIVTTILIVWFEQFYPFEIPIVTEIKTLAMIRWLILLGMIILALSISLGYLLWRIKKLKEPPKQILSPKVLEIIGKHANENFTDD